MPTDETVQAFSQLPTAAISDALDSLGIATQPIGIKPLTHTFRLAGRAWTLKYRAIGEVERGTVGDYIDDIEPGQVIVLDNAGRLDRTVWGDILTLVAKHRGVAGTVINGICRDVARAIEVNYPIYSLDHWMRTGKDRVEVDATQVPVSLGDVQVRPGDILIGDADGIVVIPQSREQEVLKRAQEIEVAEKAIEEAVVSGVSLREARAKNRYHSLQSR
ncbi:MAG TPA: RraA family protein [Chloroflexota bacterium]|jgi:regulator of RNase E activity RraA|nr:RraA family protein [Chloroflexota bacterium]